MRRRRSTDDGAPMPALMLQILLALAREPAHGYSVLQEIERRMDADYEIGAATLYRTIRRLTEAGLIEEARVSDEAHSQRRVYAITERGRLRLGGEVERLRRLVDWAGSLGLASAGPA